MNSNNNYPEETNDAENQSFGTKNIATPSFMIVDDDPLTNHVCRKYINMAFPHSNVVVYTNPSEALGHIQSDYALHKGDTILLLDLHMPILSGWEVLDQFMNFPEDIKKQFRIFIHTSSVAGSDKNKANNHPLVSGFIEKPLTIEQLKTMEQLPGHQEVI